MKATVLKRFKDKFTGKIYNIGYIYKSSEERVKELQEMGFLGEVSIIDGNVEEIKVVTESLDKESLKDLLEKEQKGKNRKGVIEHIESLLKEGE